MQNANALPDVLTHAQAADYLQLARCTVVAMIRDGRLPAFEVRPGIYRISRAAVDQLLMAGSR